MVRIHGGNVMVGKCASAAIFAFVAGFAAHVDAADWRTERWTVEDFTGAIGGGPAIGPAAAADSGFRPAALCGDDEGNIYMLCGHAVFIVTADGMKRRLAGRDRPGYCDGPATRAMFDQGNPYNIGRGIQRDNAGNLFVTDNGNRVVRRIYNKDDGWHVETWAGGGKRELRPGESCPAREFSMYNFAIAAGPDGQLTIATPRHAYQVTPDGKTVKNLGRWPKSALSEKGGLIIQMGDCDAAGNAYFVFRGPPADVVMKVTPGGEVSHLAGFNRKMRSFPNLKSYQKPHHIGDGPPREAYFDTPTSLTAEPDGSCVYVCGGDEYDIRRVPTDGKTTTATLMQNGRWHMMKVHPNRNRGKPVYDPAATGPPRTEGGALTNLANCHLVGRDRVGNLYGLLYPWVGATQHVASEGPLTSRVYRIRRLGEASGGRGQESGKSERQSSALDADKPTLNSSEAIRVEKAITMAMPADDPRDPVMPAVAFDGKETFLVVWQQGRDYYRAETSDIYAARVSAAGELIDEKPLALCRADDSQLRPRVAFCGNVFLIVWEDLRRGNQFDVFGVRVSVEGKKLRVLDPEGLLIAGGMASQSRPDVAPGDGKFLVAWQEFHAGVGNVLRATRIATDGRVIDKPPVAIATADGPARGGNISLVKTREGWFAFWRLAASGIKGAVARLTERQGSLVTPEAAGPLPHFSGALGSPASDGRHVLYAGTSITGRGRSFRPCTGLLFNAGSVKALANPNPPIKMGASGWNTTRMFCLHTAMPGVEGPVAAAFGGKQYLVVASGSSREKPPHRHQMFVGRVAVDGKRLDDVKKWHALTDGKRHAAHPAVAAGVAGRFLVVYESDGGVNDHRLVAALLQVR